MTEGFDKKDERKLCDLEILAELQHFRAATFLIDFTYSAQVALWFACQGSFKDSQNSKELSDGKVSVVFANPDRIIEVTPELIEQDISVFFETDDGREIPALSMATRGSEQSYFAAVFRFLCLVVIELLNLIGNASS